MPPIPGYAAARMARRAVPAALAVKRWWDNLPQERKDEYRARAMDAAERGRKAVESRRKRR